MATSPLAVPLTFTKMGPRSARLKALFPLTISTTRVLLGSSKRTNFPSRVSSPKAVVVVVTGQPTVSVCVVWVLVLTPPVASGDRVVSVRSVRVVWQAASTSVPFQLVFVVVVRVSVRLCSCANSKPAKRGMIAIAIFMVNSYVGDRNPVLGVTLLSTSASRSFLKCVKPFGLQAPRCVAEAAARRGTVLLFFTFRGHLLRLGVPP